MNVKLVDFINENIKYEIEKYNIEASIVFAYIL